MRLDEIRSRITVSSKDDWEQIVCWGSGSGPSYLTSLTVWSKANDGLGLEVVSHSNIAVYREDVDLRLAWGWDPDENDRPELSFPWQDKFPDSGVSRLYADVFWRGSLVDRLLLLGIDGGHALLPIGEPKYDKSKGYAWITNNVDQWEYLFARLIHSFEHSENFDRYFDQAGFTRV